MRRCNYNDKFYIGINRHCSGRITEMGQPISVAIISGVLIGALSHYAINQIKKSITYGNRNDN